MHPQYFFANKQEPSLPYYQTLEVLKFENVVEYKICSLAFKLYNNPLTVPAIFHNFLIPTTTVHSYNTRNSAKLIFYRPQVQVRTNIDKFTFKYSASVMWETVPLALKKAKTFNKLTIVIVYLYFCLVAAAVVVNYDDVLSFLSVFACCCSFGCLYVSFFPFAKLVLFRFLSWFSISLTCSIYIHVTFFCTQSQALQIFSTIFQLSSVSFLCLLKSRWWSTRKPLLL